MVSCWHRGWIGCGRCGEGEGVLSRYLRADRYFLVVLVISVGGFGDR